MMVRIIEIDDVDDPKPCLQEWNVIIGDRIRRDLINKYVIMPGFLRSVPHPSDNLGRLRN